MGVFESEYRHLNAQQRKAVDIIEGPLLVVAGPGTGKTQLLGLRVANILRKTDVHPHNILCLTFTESGKEAMQLRLAKFLGKAAKRVEVHTFHGFGNRLISRFPEFFTELDRFRPADDLTLYETLLACFERLPRSNPIAKHAYGQFVYQQDASARISQLKRAGISPEAVIRRAQIDADWSKANGRNLVKIFKEAGSINKKSASFITDKLQASLDNTQESELGNLCNTELSAALEGFSKTGKTPLITAYKKKWFTTSGGELIFKPAEQMKKLLALAELYSDYENELRKRRLYDYDDMILFTLEKLKHNPEFLAAVQESFQYILADEYQDTNAAQASIINLIADNPVNEGRPNVMVVGDDDQAIYGFQGALGDVLMDFRERWREVSVVTLKDNYRSTKSILGTSRTIITQGQNRLENHYQDIDKSLNAQVEYQDIKPIHIETSSPQAVIDKAVAVAKSSDQNRQLAIVASKHKYLRELADALDAAKIKYYYEGHEDLLSDDSMSKILLLAETGLAIKQKDYARTNYLLPEIIALNLLDIDRPTAWKVAIKAKTEHISWWQSLLDLDAVAAKPLKQIVANMDNKQASKSLKDIGKDYNLRIVQKVNRLIKHAESYFEREEISLSEMLRYTDLCKRAGVRLEQTIAKGSKQSNVVLLSAHKSKGLEFDRVYILHADYRTWFKEAGRRNNLVLPDSWKSIEPQAANTDDRLRLLYVVMTRAKQELALIKSVGTDLLPGLDDLIIEQHVAEQVEAFDVPQEQTWREWYMPKTAKELSTLKDLLKPTMQTYRLSPTHLTMFLDVAHGGPVTFCTSILLGITEPAHPEIIFGNNVHRSLNFAQSTLNKTGKLPSIEQITKFLEQETTISDIELKDTAQTVDNYLKQTQVIKKDGVGEYSFSSKKIVLDNKRLTGTVDNYLLEEGRLTITDFKTGRAINAWRIYDDYYKQKLHRFRQQLIFYEMLFKLSDDYTFESVTSKIAFVEPIRADVYYELTLDADVKERQRFDQLLSVVWQKITNLDLPNTQMYSLDMNGLTAFEDDLISGQI